MSFDAPVLLALAPLIALLLGGLALLARRRRIVRAASWSAELEQQARATGKWGPVLLAIAALAAVIGLAGPRGGRATVKVQTQSLSVVLAVDISRSMLAEDTRPSRLGRAVQEARRLVQDLSQDRVGLVAFAGRSYILSPLTLDGGAVTLFLDALSPELASQGGTGLAAALTQGMELLNASREAGDRVLVVFSDGETHDSLPDVIAAAKRLREEQVRLVLVAEGTPRPVPIPLRDSTGQVVEYKLDEEGKTVETRRRDDVLQKVADAAEGALVPAELSDQAGAVRELLSAYQRVPTSSSSTQDLLPLVWIPALIAATCLAAQTVSRRTAALVSIAAVLLCRQASAQRTAPGEAEWRQGKMAEAAALLVRRLTEQSPDTAWYNAGTALLAAGNYVGARKALARAGRSLDPDLRYRALYNEGVAALRQAGTDSSARDSLLADASDNLRDALSLVPGSRRAKWNLELAERRRPPPPSGGGGNSPQPPPPQGQQPQDPQAGQGGAGRATPNLSQAQAEQILNSVSREERDTRVRRLGKAHNPLSTEKDW
ncbi:MAG: VWA domain-containing protein [Gemmatimonadales bacterium]